jgi:membrane protein implicated in regulation of membrane protease activity
MGALLTSIAAFCGLLGLHGLIIVFVLLSIAIFAGSRPLARRLGGRRGKKGEHDTNIDGLVGRAAVVTQEIGGHHKPGYVKVGGEEWRAIPVQDSAIPAGTMVQVTKVEGATLTVMQNPIEEGGES